MTKSRGAPRGVLVLGHGAWHLFCDRKCAWLYFATGENPGWTNRRARWGCLFCGLGILDEDNA